VELSFTSVSLNFVQRGGEGEKSRTLICSSSPDSTRRFSLHTIPGRGLHYYRTSLERKKAPKLHHVNARMILITKTQEESVLKFKYDKKYMGLG
jgi:hypothetical protein